MELIVAVDRNWGIGYHGTQPVVVSEDRKRFRQLTKGAAVIVGRRTLEDFPGGKPLPNRRNLVLTRDPSFAVEGSETVHSVEEALEAVSGEEKVFVIGGASVYRQLLPFCDRAHVTLLDAAPPADAFFPNLDADPAWVLSEAGAFQVSETPQGSVRYRFLTYKRI